MLVPAGKINFNNFPKSTSIFRDYFLTHKQYQLNKRVKIDTGKFCNAQCNFCYYLPETNSKLFLKPNDLKEFIPKLLSNGIREFEFSGGEPTLNKQLQEIVEAIICIAQKEDVYQDELHFSIVTNGIKAQEVERTIPQIKEFLFSIHGTEEVHDQIVKAKGSYQRIMEFISHHIEKEHPLLLRVNVVLTNDNIDNIQNEFIDTLKWFIKSGIQINFLPMNFWSSATGIFNQDKIFEGIDNIIEKLYQTIKEFPNNNSLLRSEAINIRYVQICKISPKAREFARGHLDHYFDRHDWNKVWYPQDNLDKLNIHTNLDIEEINTKVILESLAKESSQSHYKDNICATCPELSCDGIKFIDQQKKLIPEETQEDKDKRIEYIDFKKAKHARKFSQSSKSLQS